ncbi:unnamed protein product [Scytosiphon promiscuus]
MAASSGLASPALRLPKLSPTAAETAQAAGGVIKVQKPSARPRRGTGDVVGGTDEKETAGKLDRRSSSLPLTGAMKTAGDEVVQVMPGTSLVLRGPRLRRRSGDFSLPVRYKYVVIPGNNSRAVLAAFRRRPWWGPARKEDDPSAANVVRSSFVSRRKKSGKKSAPGGKLGYSNKAFHLWWEMYASRPVIEGTNLDANLRQAVNHFEFNDTLVSKKGLWQSLRAYCTSRGISVTTVVPQTFYLSGGAVRSSALSSDRVTPCSSRTEEKHGVNSDSSGSSSGDGGSGGGAAPDDRAEFFSFCAAMDDPPAASCQARASLREPPPPPTSVVESGLSLHGTLGSRSEPDARLASPPSLPLSPHLAVAQPSRTEGSPESCLQIPWESSSPAGNGAKRVGKSAPAPGAGTGGPKSRNVCTDPAQCSATASRIDAGETATFVASQVGDRDGRRRSWEPSGVVATEGGPTRGSIRPEVEGEVSPGKDGHHPGCSSNAGKYCGMELERKVERGRTGGGMQTERVLETLPTWVVKPAANSNCGFGIQVCCSLKEVLSIVDAPNNKAGRRGWVVQRYIERPLLVRGRKFDIRLFVLLVADPSTRSWRRQSRSVPQAPEGVCRNGSNANFHEDCTRGQPGKARCTEKNPALQEAAQRQQEAGVGVGPTAAPANGSNCRAVPQAPCPLTAWGHQDAYVRTSSVRYSNDPSKVKDRFVHLTNNAVQRRSPSYGQDEPGNKLTLQDLQEWLDGDESGHKGHAHGWIERILRPRMHDLVATSIEAAANAGINKRGRPHAFELLGYDFMVDDDLQVWLIEVNSNPCLEFVCPLLQGMIVRVIEDTLSIALDSVFRPPEKHRTAAIAGLGGTLESRNGFSKVYPPAD